MTFEDLLIGLPWIRYLHVHTNSPNGLPVTTGVQTSRLLIAQVNRVPNDQVDSAPSISPIRSKMYYFTAHGEEDPFPDPSLLDPIEEDKHEKIRVALGEMKK